MEKRKFRLYYKDLELGTITQDDFDFPNVFGYFQLVDSIEKKNELTLAFKLFKTVS